LFEENLELLEAKLNGLLSVVREAGIDQEREKELRTAVENAHYGRFGDEEEYLDLLRGVVRDLRPTVMNSDWQQAWGNIFTQLINDLKSSAGGPGRIIRGLYGPEALPAEAEKEKVLCINPGSTSTKVALFEGFRLIDEEEVHLPPDYDDSVESRTGEITKWLSREGIGKDDLDGIACRGGFVGGVPTGTYLVCDEMIGDVKDPIIEHASNMGVQIGMILHDQFGCGENTLVSMTDPVASDEMETTARLTGIQKIIRDGRGVHYLNQRAVHRLACHITGLDEDKATTVGAHIGGGISVVRHEDGKIVDVVNAFSGIPSANRCGNIPLGILLRAIDNKEMSLHELKKYLYGQGGMLDLTGTNDFRALLHFRDSGAMGNQKKKIDIVIDFMARNIAGAIMKLAAVNQGVDLVLLTGGLARSGEFTSMIGRKLYPHFSIAVTPGSMEYESLVAGHLRARYNPSGLKDYHSEKSALRKKREEEEKLFATEIFSDPQLRKKETEPVISLDEVAYMARSMVAARKPPVIAIVGAENEDAVVAAKQANEEGRYPVAKFLLVGDYYEVNKIAWDYDITVDGDNYTIVDSRDPVEKAIALLDAGKADLLMKGSVKTADIMKATLGYLKKSGRMKKEGIYSHVGVFQIPTYPRLLFVSDAALIPNPPPKIKRKIIENAVMVARHLNIIKPRVALISAVETMIPSVESSMQAGELAREYAGREDCIVEGPLSLDIAMDPHSAREKHYRGQIKGNADILIMPDIEAGNVVYKSLTVSSGAYLAGVIVGGGIPIVLTSRGDSARSKLSSICLASIIALRQGDIEQQS